MATHSSILAWEIPWTEKPGRATVHGVTERVGDNSATKQQHYKNNMRWQIRMRCYPCTLCTVYHPKMWLVFLFFPADFLTEAQNSYLSRLLSGEFGKVFLTPRLWYLVVSHVSLTGSPEMGRTSLKVPIIL